MQCEREGGCSKWVSKMGTYMSEFEKNKWSREENLGKKPCWLVTILYTCLLYFPLDVYSWKTNFTMCPSICKKIDDDYTHTRFSLDLCKYLMYQNSGHLGSSCVTFINVVPPPDRVCHANMNICCRKWHIIYSQPIIRLSSQSIPHY